MSRLSSWYERCAFLWKGRPRKDPNEMVASMEQMLGASKYGDRAAAAKHYQAFGPKASRSFGSHPEGSNERMAFEFSREVLGLNRRKGTQRLGDSLTSPIDQAHIEHHGETWAAHNNVLEHVPRADETEEGARALQGHKFQSRSLKVQRRIKHMAGQGHAEPYATMDDLNTIHTGVERAIHAGKVPTADANRYHVMRHAIKLNHARHSETYPGLPFKPSFAAMDTAALRTMKTGVDHLDETGFREAKQRLGGMLGSAVESHSVHPFEDSATRLALRHSVAMSYPALHEIGSPAHAKQQKATDKFMARVDRSRMAPSRKAELKQKKTEEKSKEAAKNAPLEMPSSYDEFRQRQDSGESFDPKVVARMEMQRRMKKSLFAEWKSWRGEAA